MVKYGIEEMTRMKYLLPVFCCLALLVPFPAAAQTLTIEAEYYTASHDIDYAPITAMGPYLEGLDCADEWTEYQVGVSNFGLYSVQMYCRGNYNVNYLLRLIMTPMGSGDVQTIDIPFKGAGWG